MDGKDLAIRLAKAETEEEVIDILDNLNVWNDYSYWRPFGDNDNNYSTIGNQQSSPDSALVEKLVNSVDAVLMKECLVRNIDMSSDDAPQSMEQAMEMFYGIKNGQLSYLDSKERNKLSENIYLIATGTRRQVNYTIVDKGEGQSPKSMPNTILSISRNNKLKVPFVQGKFNMGGTGILPFCGEHKFQLVISKRCPDIKDENDDTRDLWSVTIVRREPAREGRKSSMFTYLTTGESGELISFVADTLPIIPTNNGKESQNMEYGTFIKLFDYNIKGYKTAILLNLYYRLAMLMPSLAHPIRLRECRNYEAHSYETTLSGLETRLADDREDNVEDSFPISTTFSVDNVRFKCLIYVFKKGKSANYRENDGVMFVINGQTHAFLPQTFFNKANLGFLADSLLVMVDCSEMDIQHREDMFMNSRDRLREGDFSNNVKERIRDLLKDNEGLKQLQQQRKEEAVRDKINDDKPLQDVLQDILKKSPILSNVLLTGIKLKNPFDIRNNIKKEGKFKGKFHPTYFRILGKKINEGFIKNVPVNHDFRIQFETDAVNDYFSRSREQGNLVIKMNGISSPNVNKHFSLFNGIATLTLTLPENSKVGDVLNFEVEVEDEYILDNFYNTFTVNVLEEKDYKSGNSSTNKPKVNSDKNKRGNNNSEKLNGIPEVIDVYSDEWDKYGMTKETALIIRTVDDGDMYFLNADNQYLLSELKGISNKEEIDLNRAKYKYGMVLVGMAVMSNYKNSEKDINDNIDPATEAERITKMISPILLPLIDSMSDLDLNDE